MIAQEEPVSCERLSVPLPSSRNGKTGAAVGRLEIVRIWDVWDNQVNVLPSDNFSAVVQFVVGRPYIVSFGTFDRRGMPDFILI